PNTHPNAAAGIADITGSMIALNVILVDAEIIQVDKKAVEEDHPKSRHRKPRQFKAAQAELIFSLTGFDDIIEATVQLGYDQVQDQQGAECFNDRLHYFCPDHRFHTTHHG